MTSVHLQKIDQSFGRLNVLRGLDFRVESGQYLVLLGASGGGKTTTLRIIAGLQAPTRGAVFLDGVDVAALPPRSRDVAMVFQHDSLYPHKTVAGSLQFGLKSSLGRSGKAKRVTEAARLTGIESLLDRYPHHLSGGQLRRAAIAKAVARQGGVRLLDEPLSSLDAQAREGLQADLLRWHRSLGGTTIHVTHDGQEAMRMADVIGVLNNGHIDQCAAPDQIYRDPKTLAVARAIGTPTIQCFEACFCAGKWMIQEESQASVDLSIAAELNEIVLAVRPEGLRVESSEVGHQSRYPLRIPGRLQRCSFSGRDLVISVQCGRQTVTAVHAIDAQFSAQPGDDVWVCGEQQDLLVFDAATGNRVHQ
ncbi:MAG: ABC transporter ATP-binding protein [Rubripirellula sp.]|nr:ABC transporter ATP-binding protein [Rubripirellula sp.]